MTTDPSLPSATPRGPQWVNVGLFAGVLLALGLLLGRNVITRSAAPELSETENRALAQAPELRWSTIDDGSFALGVDRWIADHFPARERFLTANFWLTAHRGWQADDEPALYMVEIDTDAELEPLDGDAGFGLELDPLDGDDLELDEDLELEPDPFDDDAGEPSSIIKTKGILVVDGRAMQLFAGSPRGSRRYARTVNRYASKLPDQVVVYSLIVPTAQTFYLPEEYRGRVRHEPPNIAATYAMMDAEVKTVDVVAALRGYTDEYIYFRTDHHWTGLGAYYAYVGFCEAAGLQPVALESLQSGTISPYRGSLYRYTRDQKLHRKPDEIQYWLPPIEVSVTRASGRAGELIRAQSSGYGVFLGGDHPLLVARSQAQTGRRALLIKNSYGNPFAVFLAAHFDTLVIVDYRKFDGSVADLVKEHEITDLIILNGAITSNAKFHIERIARLLDGRVPTR